DRDERDRRHARELRGGHVRHIHLQADVQVVERAVRGPGADIAAGGRLNARIIFVRRGGGVGWSGVGRGGGGGRRRKGFDRFLGNSRRRRGGHQQEKPPDGGGLTHHGHGDIPEDRADGGAACAAAGSLIRPAEARATAHLRDC